MPDQIFSLKIVMILTIGFAFASTFGYLTYRAKLSPILGYLIAGYLIGPYSPGFVADVDVAEQLAEIGVVLMMFNVGLHFKWQTLVSTSTIAIPGALCQTSIATIVGAALAYNLGWSIEAGIIFGFAIGVASTVVLLRVLSENKLLHTLEGHISLGWLIVEDILTVGALFLVPTLSSSLKGDAFSLSTVVISFLFSLFKFFSLAIIFFTIGKKVVAYILEKILITKSHELFTLTILAITFVIATASALFFGTSLALGSLVAGMVIGQTHGRHQATENSTPLRDIFLVIFFLTMGMLFNPASIHDHFVLFLSTLCIILIIKPLVAFTITLLLKYPYKTAIAISVGLAQIGEFSFILAEESMKFNILPDEGFDILVACSLVSISVNPLFFKLFKLVDCKT